MFGAIVPVAIATLVSNVLASPRNIFDGIAIVGSLVGLCMFLTDDDPINLSAIQECRALIKDMSPERALELHKSFLRQAVTNHLPQLASCPTVPLRHVTRHNESIYIPAYMHVIEYEALSRFCKEYKIILPHTGQVLAQWPAPTGLRRQSERLIYL